MKDIAAAMVKQFRQVRNKIRPDSETGQGTDLEKRLTCRRR